MINKTISHYQIIEELGRGGMGVVYKAEDTKLKRTVALKFLPPELTRDPEAKQRFIHEAQAASSLDHPNVCTIYEINETEDGRMFIAMPSYEGETLKEKLKWSEAGHGMPVEEAVDIALQVARGLLEAHQKGIAHRDIKPANIMTTSHGTAKILDFGLAKLSGQTRLTKTGSTLGTVAYMSPEQVKGKEVDHRTDIWSLGVLLYEMLTGTLPFKGEYDQAVLYSILNLPLEPASSLRPDIPPGLEKIVDRCIQKETSARYPNMKELVTDLERLKKESYSEVTVPKSKSTKSRSRIKGVWMALSGIVLAGVLTAVILYFVHLSGEKHIPFPSKRLVVLPFENVGPAENEYFTDGITEELTIRLASLSGLGVISRTSAVQYVKTNKTIEQIGKELDVDYALEGAVRWARGQDGSSRVRITPNLTRISDKTTLWAQTYDRIINDIFAVQSEISQKVVEKLGITLLEQERRTVETPPTENLDAYQAYLRARYYEGRPHFTVENWMRVVESYEQAAELDPGFTLAFAELASAHANLYYYWHDHSADRLDLARKAAEKALTEGTKLPAVHLALGYYHLYGYRNPEKALEEFAVAEKGMPHNAEIFNAKAAVYLLQGRVREAMESSRKAFSLSPSDGSVAVDMAEFSWILRRYEEAFKTCNQAIALAPDDAWPYLIKTFVLWSWKGAFTETHTVLQAVPQEHDWAPWTWFWQDVFERQYHQAVERLYSLSDTWIRTKCWAMPKSLLAAFADKLSGKQEKSLQEYESAKFLLEAEIRGSPDDPRYHSSLGIAYANLGRKEEAIREGRKAVELLPISRDAFYGIPYVEDLAFIYTITGEADAALERLDYLLSIPSWMSVAWLRMDPKWDALRDLPKFKKLIEKYAEQ
jgi:serine/threonine protein kinase/tetratricopeptide (TPR) repeat protein